MRTVRALRFLAVVFAVGACSPAGGDPADTAAAVDRGGEGIVTFTDRVWRVEEGSEVAAGQLYVLLSEGTLVVASPNGRRSLGSWSREGEDLRWVEEGIPYRVEILALSRHEFRVRSHNPGGVLEIRMVPADARRSPDR